MYLFAQKTTTNKPISTSEGGNRFLFTNHCLNLNVFKLKTLILGNLRTQNFVSEISDKMLLVCI